MKSKNAIRILSLLLCLLCLLPLAACADDGETLPDGMQNATAAGADFRLYIPTTWSLNTAYGVSGGYYSLYDQSTVSVVKYAITEQMRADMAADEAVIADPDSSSARMDWFFRTALRAQAEQLVTGGVEELEAPTLDLLGGANARRYHYKGNIKGADLFFVQVVAEKNDAFYVFSFTAAENLYELLYNEDRASSNVGLMLSEFVFADPYVPADPSKTLEEDDAAPTGMKKASGKAVMYNLYVPSDWTVDLNQAVYSAKSPDGLAVVSVTPFMPTDAASSVVDYFAETQEMLAGISGGTYQKHVEAETTLGGGEAMEYEYSLQLGGTAYRYRQIIVGYRGMIYSLTYTARETDYNKHLDDMNAIVDAFTFG